MNSVDRATLIDFALGRLEDAEAAALARRAEVDSEFAQTLDALRQELTTLDRVRSDADAARPADENAPIKRKKKNATKKENNAKPIFIIFAIFTIFTTSPATTRVFKQRNVIILRDAASALPFCQEKRKKERFLRS